MGVAEGHPETESRIAGFRRGLEKRGWFEGRNVRIDYRYSPGGLDAQKLAKELIASDLLIKLAAQHRLPTVYFLSSFVAAGGLMSYGVDFGELVSTGGRLCGSDSAR
jgi:hypothetical protein